MLKSYLLRLVQKYGPWRVIHILLAGITTLLLLTTISFLLVPVQTNIAELDVAVNTDIANFNSMTEPSSKEETNTSNLLSKMRGGMFKSASNMRARTMADKTVEKIKSQLKLQCVMKMNGQQIAYINIKNSGMKKCEIGDTVDDLFTVMDIQKKIVDITILGHKVTLRP